jgi:cysteine desulfurase / selenocysteine lyase
MSHRGVPARCRDDFPSLERRRSGRPPVYLDNACTTLVPRPVIAALDEYYTDHPSCGGRRGAHWFAEEVTRRIEGDAEDGIKGARQSVAELVNAGSKDEIVFTANTTHAINTVALGFRFKPGDVVLLADREHNSNLLPWLRLQASGLIRVDHAVPDRGDGFDPAAFEAHFRDERVRLVSMAYTSNVTGVTLPAEEIVAIAHRHGARVLLDGAQTVPHRAVDVRALDADFLAFSLHKMCGPRGVGVLYAKRELLGRGAGEWDAGDDVIEPAILGGGTVDDATYDSYRLLDGPERFEAGIPDYAGLIAAGAAVQYVRQIGMERIAAHEEQLNAYLTGALLARYGDTGWFSILGPEEASRRSGILTFEVRRPNAVGIAAELSAKSNVMIRDGAFCVHSYFNERFGPSWMRPRSHRDHRMVYRVSLYLYNTLEECDVFLETLDEIFRERSYI